jgi:hypothetical protein
MFAKIIKFILTPWTRYQERKRFKKRLAELRKRDPFIYE